MAASKVSRRTVQLFYDVVSPYSWVAFEVLSRYKERWNLDLKLCPVFLGGIMKETGNKPPGVVPAKANYFGKDLQRMAKYYGIPIRMPSNLAELMFANGSISAQRLLTAANENMPETTESLTRELWLKAWSRDEDIVQVEGLRKACSNVGLSQEVTDMLIGQIKDDKTKQKLKETTEEALNIGAFGAPTIVVHKDGKREMFFGSDRFHLIADMYGLQWQGPLREESKL